MSEDIEMCLKEGLLDFIKMLNDNIIDNCYENELNFEHALFEIAFSLYRKSNFLEKNLEITKLVNKENFNNIKKHHEKLLDFIDYLRDIKGIQDFNHSDFRTCINNMLNFLYEIEEGVFSKALDNEEEKAEAEAEQWDASNCCGF